MQEESILGWWPMAQTNHQRQHTSHLPEPILSLHPSRIKTSPSPQSEWHSYILHIRICTTIGLDIFFVSFKNLNVTNEEQGMRTVVVKQCMHPHHIVNCNVWKETGRRGRGGGVKGQEIQKKKHKGSNIFFLSVFFFFLLWGSGVGGVRATWLWEQSGMVWMMRLH